MWEQIRLNRRRSLLLVVVIAALLIALGFFIGEAVEPGAGPVGVIVAAIIWIVLSLVAYFQGDSILLSVSGAREIQKSDHPRLFNIVEEMTIAAGLPKMPRVFIIDDMALNAFATGRSPETASVAVTAGLLGRLSRDELQGVIAHEMTHVINRDVLFMSMVGVMLGAIVMISDMFLRGFLRVGGGRSRRFGGGKGGGQAQAVMLIVAILLAILSPILAQLIYFAISRRREYLADAGASVLTRYPEGLASALSVLAADTAPLVNANKATAPMYIVNPFQKAGRMALNLSSTHPPIEDRIRVLRSMAGGAGYQQYEAAWRRVHGGRRGVMPASVLVSGGEAVPIRAPSVEAQAPAVARQRMREAGDAVRRISDFAFLDCACGLRVKVPPDFNRPSIACPRCRAELALPGAGTADKRPVAGIPFAKPRSK